MEEEEAEEQVHCKDSAALSGFQPHCTDGRGS